MSEHLPLPIEVTDIIAKDNGLKTKRYYIQTMMKQVIDRYIISLNDFSEMLLQHFSTCLVLEDHFDHNDLIDGAYQIYEKGALLRDDDQGKGYKRPTYQFRTLTEIINEGSFKNISERELLRKSAREQEILLRARDLLEELTAVMELFNAPTAVHMKFVNLQLYSIKRLNHLVHNLDDYNPACGGKDLKYQGRLWSDSLPADSELIASIFCHLLDVAYYGSIPRQDYRNSIGHYISSSNGSSINCLSEDQLGLMNMVSHGYEPYYQYVYKRQVYQVP